MGSSIRDGFLNALYRRQNKQKSTLAAPSKPCDDTLFVDIDIAAANRAIASKFSRPNTPAISKSDKDYSYLIGVSVATLAVWLHEEIETHNELIYGLNKVGYARKEAVKMVNRARSMIGDYR